jgi:hypothetical protein
MDAALNGVWSIIGMMATALMWTALIGGVNLPCADCAIVTQDLSLVSSCPQVILPACPLEPLSAFNGTFDDKTEDDDDNEKNLAVRIGTSSSVFNIPVPDRTQISRSNRQSHSVDSLAQLATIQTMQI